MLDVEYDLSKIYLKHKDEMEAFKDACTELTQKLYAIYKQYKPTKPIEIPELSAKEKVSKIMDPTAEIPPKIKRPRRRR